MPIPSEIRDDEGSAIAGAPRHADALCVGRASHALLDVGREPRREASAAFTEPAPGLQCLDDGGIGGERASLGAALRLGREPLRHPHEVGPRRAVKKIAQAPGGRRTVLDDIRRLGAANAPRDRERLAIGRHERVLDLGIGQETERLAGRARRRRAPTFAAFEALPAPPDDRERPASATRPRLAALGAMMPAIAPAKGALRCAAPVANLLPTTDLDGAARRACPCPEFGARRVMLASMVVALAAPT